MTTLSLQFEWWRDSRGYALKKLEAKKIMISEIIPFMNASYDSSEWIVRKGGKQTRYFPLVEFGDALFSVFAKIRTPEGALAFVQNFGPLTQNGLRTEEPPPKVLRKPEVAYSNNVGDYVGQILGHADMMRFLCEQHRQHGRHGLARNTRLKECGIPVLARLLVDLVIDPVTDLPKLTLRSPDLLTALWVQCGQKLAEVERLSSCVQCGTFFAAGPGTGRRADAKFCSDQHRITFNSLERSREK